MSNSEALEILRKGEPMRVVCVDTLIELKTGKWKHIWDAPDGTYKGMCENCGFTHIFFDGNDSQYNFCPNCGSYNGGNSDEQQ